MDWNLAEALEYYKRMGAPKDQSALISLLREVQQNHNGSIPLWTLSEIATGCGIKESLLQALIRRIPSLRLSNVHTLELCAGPNCGKHTALAACAEQLHAASHQGFTLKFVPCMRMCAKGPNIKWDSVLHHEASKELLEKLLTDAGIEF